MDAMLLRALAPLSANPSPLSPERIPDPEPGPGEVRLRVAVCGVCHTELDEIEGRLPPPRLPVVLGHQAVGVVEALGPGVDGDDAPAPGDRVGVAWIYAACGACEHCRAGNENLCPRFRATGRDADGGYAELMTVPAAFTHPIPESLSDAEAAPLLCAGAIGYRSLHLTGVGDGARLGLTGFGASGHLVLKLVRYLLPDVEVFVFARSARERAFATELGAVWTGDTRDRAPARLHGIIDTTPAWRPVVEALANLEAGGRLVINAIRKETDDQESLLDLDYPTHLWMEREVKSVANVTRSDVRGFLRVAADAGLRPDVEEYGLRDANEALRTLKEGHLRGAKVLRIA